MTTHKDTLGSTLLRVPFTTGIAVLFLSISPPARAAILYHSDTFSAGTVEGWGGGANPTFVAEGGPDGAGDGFLRIGGVGSPIATHVSTSPWTGDYLMVGATAISVDLMLSASAPEPFEMRAVILGPDTQNRRTSQMAQTVPPDGEWRRYTFSLADDDLVVVQGDSGYPSALGSVARFMFRHDPPPPEAGGTVAEGLLGLDNVTLIPEPEPATLVAVPLVVAALRRRRRPRGKLLGAH